MMLNKKCAEYITNRNINGIRNLEHKSAMMQVNERLTRQKNEKYLNGPLPAVNKPTRPNTTTKGKLKIKYQYSTNMSDITIRIFLCIGTFNPRFLIKGNNCGIKYIIKKETITKTITDTIAG